MQINMILACHITNQKEKISIGLQRNEQSIKEKTDKQTCRQRR